MIVRNNVYADYDLDMSLSNDFVSSKDFIINYGHGKNCTRTNASTKILHVATPLLIDEYKSCSCNQLMFVAFITDECLG